MKVLVADDHPLFREGLVSVLAGLPGVEVVAEVGDGAQAVSVALELRPDVVVMDLHMPGINGVEATRLLTEQAPEVAVLVLSMLESDSSIASAVRAGAAGYVLKGAGRDVISAALMAVASGASYFGPGVRLTSLSATPRATVPHPAFPGLTDREFAVLTLVAGGLSNAAIGARLHLSDKTVRNYVSAVLGKVGAPDRAAAVALARDHGVG